MSLAPTIQPEGTPPPAPAVQTVKQLRRPKLRSWDRLKYILVLVTAWFMLVWASMANDPILPFQDAMRGQVTGSAWLLVLNGIEIVRQVHFLLAENWAGYWYLWSERLLGRGERYAQRRLSDYSRHLFALILKWVAFIALVVYIISRFLGTSPILAVFHLPALLWSAMPFVAQLAFAFFFVIFQFVGLFWFLSRGGVDTYFPDDIKTRFSDVWGQDHVLDRVKENIVYLERPHEIEDHGGYVPGGVLLWGPPGTGKTLMAEAVAGETGKPYVFVDPGAFTNMFMGVGILKVKSLFRKLRKLALRYGGVIVFFDEADALGSRGAFAQQGGFQRMTYPNPFQSSYAATCHGFTYVSPEGQYLMARSGLGPAMSGEIRDKQIMGMGGMGGGGGMGTLQALLTELSGLKKPRGFLNRYVRRALNMKPKPPPKYRILVMMATNLPEALDPALLRPGRIDRIYKVGYPSKPGRVRTYNGYLAKVRHTLTLEDVDKLATITPYATGATIKDTVNEALIAAIRDGRDVIEWKDVIKAKQLKDLGPPEDVDYIERERHAVAVHEACHALVAYRQRRHRVIDIATIEKGADYLGMVASVKPEDQFNTWKGEHEADILTSLASLAGERMFFDGDNSQGVSGDLEFATLVATNMEAVWGMGATVAALVSRGIQGMPVGKQGEDDSAFKRRDLGDRIEANLSRLLDKATEILEQNRREVLALAHALEMHKTLAGEDVVAVIERRLGPIIDGRPYSDEGFTREIEAYHRAALAAHKGHTGIMLTLPVPPDLGDGSDWSGPRTPQHGIVLPQAAGPTAGISSDGATPAVPHSPLLPPLQPFNPPDNPA